jgi:hypothetical protein
LFVARAIYGGIDDPKYDYIYDITEDFCERKEFKGKYTPLITTLCPKMFDVPPIISVLGLISLGREWK